MAAGFGAQLAVAFPPLGCDGSVAYRSLHGAAQLAGVAAVAKAAPRGDGADLLEYALNALCAGPELQIAHTGSIDQRAACR